VNADSTNNAPAVHAEQTLAADQGAPARARESVRAACAHHVPHLLDDALLLVSEVVTNAVKHGREPVRLQVDCDGAGIVVAVEDGNPAMPRTRRMDRRRHSGRGLMLVQRLAADWGVRRTDGGKQVWFRLA
jgi:anti-sigma regulatory factor (Ser/Thr protein kinase)